SADRLLKLAPEQDDALRDRGLAYLQLEYLAGARHDLWQYLKRNPEASDAQWLREKLIDLGGPMPRLH
ncbi:tetratricopeptide repeat protein, partial [Pseudomonas aeruginosa]